MKEKDFERKNGGAANEDETPILDWENEGGSPPREGKPPASEGDTVPPDEQE